MDDFSESAATLGDRLALAREQQGLSQAQLARRLGLRVQTVRNWENDRSEPRANKLQMVAGILNVSMVWLLTGAGAGAPTAEVANDESPLELAEALSEIRDLRLLQNQVIDRLARLEKRLRLLAMPEA
ncbi:helix-turn-helix transcriptional regulator [Paralimibaculum aggregatum]|uniref:Helix-turn-helix transcriptional regulator n=1 Tax=Paralimibaculum aggregatum TaxID=3036245 RepID=A0ABQ6LQC5_9RHOB|nr:helix-turn-helix transcriptional regulator [Limibaculum sp. NKW23]GMG82720.1 helix-turn-helix transcriptional regulator [Limibaculum sp. NKW23]